MTRLLLPALLLALLVSGCTSSTPVSIAAANQAPTDRVVAFQKAAGDKLPTLTVIRDRAFELSGCYTAVHINEVLAARLASAEFARFYVGPGEVYLRAGTDPQGKGICALPPAAWTLRETRTIIFILKPSEQKVLHITYDFWGNVDIQ